MCWYVCIGFVDFMFKDKTLLEYTNLLSPKKYEKNDKIILKYFSITKKLFCVICGEYRKFKNPKILYMFEKTLFLSFICNKSKIDDQKISLRKRINWDIKNSYFNQKYVIKIRIWLKKAKAKNLDWKNID